MKMGSTDSGGYVKFTPKYITVGGKGGVADLLLWVQSYSLGNLGPHAKFQNPRTIPSVRKVKFTPKYIIVGGEAGASKMC